MSASGPERVLVFGPYPPSPGHEASQTFELVRSLVEEGHDVTVVSPVPSAAHHHADPGSPAGALALWRLLAGVDRAVVRLDAAGLLAGADPARVLPGRVALGRALRRAPLVELRLDRVPTAVSPKWVSMVAGVADVVSVDDEEQRSALVAAGLSAGRVTVDDSMAHPVLGHGRDLPAWSGTTREALQRDVRRRAAVVREAREARESGAAGRTAGRSSASLPLREIAPLGHAPIRSPKPGVAYVKRLVRKLVAWQLDPIIQHINRLHRATLDSLERAATERSDSSRPD